jgi:hypothetical protein
LFEETNVERRVAKKEAIPVEWVEKALMAEASLQRKHHPYTACFHADMYQARWK